MSKFFDETRKAQDRAQQAAVTRKSEIQQMLDQVSETTQQANTVVREMSDLRLGTCPKITVPMSASTPLVGSLNGAGEGAAESYRALRTRLMRIQATTGLRSVVISSTLQGEGKTFTAMNLAMSYARLQGTRVLLVDADLRTRGLTQLFGQPVRPGLTQVLSGQAQFQDVIASTDIPNLFFLGAGNPTAPPTELYTGERWKEFMGWCSESFKIILVDSPPILALADFELIAAGCDSALLVVRALRTQREVLRKVASRIDPKKLLGIVLNGMESDHRDYYQRYYSNGSKGA